MVFEIMSRTFIPGNKNHDHMVSLKNIAYKAVPLMQHSTALQWEDDQTCHKSWAAWGASGQAVPKGNSPQGRLGPKVNKLRC
jgi:hypothetical protein